MNLSQEFLATLITGFVSLSLYVLNQYYERKKQELEAIRKNKTPLYEEIITFFFQTLLHDKLHGKPMGEKKILSFFVDITPRLVAWGGDDVVRAFASFRSCAVEGNQDPLEIMRRFQKLLIAIRRELGHKTKNMDEDLVRLYLNDDPKTLLQK
jgi:hypothetical protein